MQVTDTNIVAAPPTAIAVDEWTLGEVAEMIHNLKAVPSLKDVEEWFSALLLRQRDYDAYRLFSKRKYARNLIARSSYAELLMLCWRSGQRTPIHDHGGSIGVVMVAEGCLTETSQRGHNYAFYSVARDLVTLHCYAPPLSVLNTFSPRSQRVRRWREGYFTGGAGI